jgi:hypothetical protein
VTFKYWSYLLHWFRGTPRLRAATIVSPGRRRIFRVVQLARNALRNVTGW